MRRNHQVEHNVLSNRLSNKAAAHGSAHQRLQPKRPSKAPSPHQIALLGLCHLALHGCHLGSRGALIRYGHGGRAGSRLPHLLQLLLQRRHLRSEPSRLLALLPQLLGLVGAALHLALRQGLGLQRCLQPLPVVLQLSQGVGGGL